MSENLRIAVLGLTHDHVWSNLKELEQTDGAELVAAADPHLPLRDQVHDQFKVPTYESFESALEQDNLDAVWLFSDNATNVDLAEMAAAAGKNIMVEKPMAGTLLGADRMLAAARQNDVRLMINWPFAWWPQMQKAIEVALSGELGDLWQVKYRAAHAGPKELGCSEYFCDWLFDQDRNGGGAMIDYCCYGALLARAILGTPSRVYGTRSRLLKEEILVEDNGVIVMNYPRAIAISEGTWTEIGKLLSYVTMIYGSQGTLMVEPRNGGRLLHATSGNEDGAEIPCDIKPHHGSAAEHFVHCLTSGDEFTLLCQARVCRDAQEILEAGMQSSEVGSEVSLPLN